MHTAILATVVAAAALSAAPAFAQDRAPFTGPHVEAVLGGDRVQGGGDHDNGLLYGAAAGYDLALAPRLRAGVEVEATDSSQKECETGAIRAGDRLCASAQRDLYIGGRLGTVIGDRTLLYVKAGYTNARYRASYDSGLATGSSRSADNLSGVRVGVGAEHMLSDKAFVKAEYRYSNYEGGASRHQIVGGVGIRF